MLGVIMVWGLLESEELIRQLVAYRKDGNSSLHERTYLQYN